MRFMIGSSPIRRTLNYLKSCKIIFRDSVKIFSVHYNTNGEHHEGAKSFVFWHFQQIQYKNPNVQCVTFQNLTPSPFIKIFTEDGNNVIIDIDSRNKEEIVDHLENFTAICKEVDRKKEKIKSDAKEQLTYFGVGCERHCICELPGQVPCPSIVKLPRFWRRKFNSELKGKYLIPPHYTELGLDDDEAS